jgi:hypothetical protein
MEKTVHKVLGRIRGILELYYTHPIAYKVTELSKEGTTYLYEVNFWVIGTEIDLRRLRILDQVKLKHHCCILVRELLLSWGQPDTGSVGRYCGRPDCRCRRCDYKAGNSGCAIFIHDA